MIKVIILFIISGLITLSHANNSYSLILSNEKGLTVESVKTPLGETVELGKKYPLFSLDLNDVQVNSLNAEIFHESEQIAFKFNEIISGEIVIETDFTPGWKAIVIFKNISDTTVKISNVVPFGQSDDHLYLTASGPWSLSRTKIFRPNLGPVGVILPDNAWESGYSDIKVNNKFSICALSRRLEWQDAKRSRWQTILQPGGTVSYVIYADGYKGAWQNGLRMIFQERYLYDLDKFDNSMFEREDIKWIRNKYTIALQFGWDHEFYDAQRDGYKLKEYLDMGDRLFGGWEVFGLWPTWPTLGVDQRNQWDLYSDLPGGLAKIRELSEYMQNRNTRFFIAYNPWDQSTRQVDPYLGMAELIKNTNANGVVLDTRGSSSKELQEAADGVKSGIVMYSEGMAIPKDMPGIVSGRVHDAIFLPPPLNLNKFIKPDFAIFRVCQLSQGRLHREFAISFFNGYGIEMNIFAPGRPFWIEEEYLYLGKLVKILRENSSAFLSQDWTPLISTTTDSIWVNKWPAKDKTLYTIFSLIPEGFDGPLFQQNFSPDSHFISLYHHEEILPDTLEKKTYLHVRTNAFDRAWLGTRKEGNVDCIAKFPNLLRVDLNGDSLSFSAEKGEKILVWAGIPSYQGIFKRFTIKKNSIKLSDQFGRTDGKFVIQLLSNNELADERIVTLKPGTPRFISKVIRTKPISGPPEDMVMISGGDFTLKINKKDSFIPYPDFSSGKLLQIKSFYMDKYPVTNAQFKGFIDATDYKSDDPVNFLKHWKNGTYPNGLANYPVVYISLEDAQAYAVWSGKRLPTEAEWQYAAQGSDGRLWPWGAEFDSTYCNAGLDKLTSVETYPEGQSPFGVMDMVGNVWQLTNDVYDNGSYYFIIMRGGSYYHPTSSWWYVKGGPQPLDESQFLLRVSQGFERNATVGFRCAVDTK